MPDAYAICSIELPTELGEPLEPEHFRVIQVIYCRETAIETLDELNRTHAKTCFCYVMQKTVVIEKEPEESQFVSSDPECNLVLVDPGDSRLEVILLLRQMFSISLDDARKAVGDGNTVVASGAPRDLFAMTERFDELGATTRIE